MIAAVVARTRTRPTRAMACSAAAPSTEERDMVTIAHDAFIVSLYLMGTVTFGGFAAMTGVSLWRWIKKDGE